MTTQERATHRRKRRLHIAAALILSTTACDDGGTDVAAADVATTAPAAASPSPAVVAPVVKPLRPHARKSVTNRPADPTAAQWARLRWCESGRDGSWHVWSRSDGRGRYQFLASTWRSVGGHGDPAAASFAEQSRRALTLWRREGWRPWRASAACTGLR